MRPLEALRPFALAGARGLLGGAFEARRVSRQLRSEADFCIETTQFPGIGELLDQLDARGIVTNKGHGVSRSRSSRLGFDTRVGCLVCGDNDAALKATSRAVAARGGIAGYRARTHRLCRRRSVRCAGRLRGGHDHRRDGVRLLRQRYPAASLAREPRCGLAGRPSATAARHWLNGIGGHTLKSPRFAPYGVSCDNL